MPSTPFLPSSPLANDREAFSPQAPNGTPDPPTGQAAPPKAQPPGLPRIPGKDAPAKEEPSLVHHSQEDVASKSPQGAHPHGALGQAMVVDAEGLGVSKDAGAVGREGKKG